MSAFDPKQPFAWVLARDADNLLRPVAHFEADQNARDYRMGLTLKKQQALVAKVAADLAERKATRGRNRT